MGVVVSIKNDHWEKWKKRKIKNGIVEVVMINPLGYIEVVSAHMISLANIFFSFIFAQIFSFNNIKFNNKTHTHIMQIIMKIHMQFSGNYRSWLDSEPWRCPLLTQRRTATPNFEAVEEQDEESEQDTKENAEDLTPTVPFVNHGRPSSQYITKYLENARVVHDDHGNVLFGIGRWEESKSLTDRAVKCRETIPPLHIFMSYLVANVIILYINQTVIQIL